MRIDEIEIKNASIFEILLDNFPDVIHSIDDSGNIVYTNRTAETLLGYSRDELLTMNIREIYAEDVLEDVERGFSDLKERGEKRVESMLKAKDGTRIPVEIRSFSIYDDDGNFLRTFSILRDIRPIKELQNSLVHAGRLAAIGELASGVAHDINNPLTVILLANDLLLRTLGTMEVADGEGLASLEKHSANIRRAAQSIQKLSEHLRNFSRGVAERQERLDLADSIADALFILDNKICKSGAVVRNRIEKGMCFTKASPNQMEQVFVNLIANACDAVAEQPEREITLSVMPWERDGAGCWRVDVADSGTGIAQEHLEEVFRSFFTTKEKGDGTGLGLSISRGIIRDHKGDIELTSTAGKGSTFSVFLPRVDTEGPEENR